MPRLTIRYDPRTGGAKPPDIADPGYGGGGDGGDSGNRGSSRRASLLGTALMLAAIGMFFGAFGGAYALRRSISRDWTPLALPGIVWLSTALIAAASTALERARRSLRGGQRAAFNRWWTLGTACGFVFLGSQWMAWRQVQGAANPAAAFFFYALTAAHAVHLAGGLIGLAYVEYHALRYRLGPERRTHAAAAAVYWHGMGIIWAGILGLFRFWG